MKLQRIFGIRDLFSARRELRGIRRDIEKLAHQNREIHLILSRMALPPSETWAGRPHPVEGAPSQRAFPHSTVARKSSFDQPHFAYWTRRLGERLRYHRKIWEFVFIVQALWERGAVRPGARALGFGVGSEPLAAYFASEDCRILATDLGSDHAAAAGWKASGSHAAETETLRRPDVCPNELFDRNVEFRPCDMNAIPADLRDFDFCWSSCALEHLGSIERGLAFIENAMDCLKPGGWAVHTTEYNFSSNDGTVDHSDTVLFRRRDLEALAARLSERGHIVAPLELEMGTELVDRYIDVPPYRDQPHLNIALAGYGVTSVGLIIQKASTAR